MNLPNKLTITRLILVVVFALFAFPYPGVIESFIDGTIFDILRPYLALIIYIVASVTDAVDGHIARRDNLVTDFGKFLDPLADKFMVISAMMCIMYRDHSNALLFNIFMWLVMVTVFRELAVASIRLIAAKNANIVVAANMLGKVKTVSQIVCVMAVLLEPVLAKISFLFFLGYYPITVASAAVTLVMTVWSGVVYIKTYWKYMDKNM